MKIGEVEGKGSVVGVSDFGVVGGWGEVLVAEFDVIVLEVLGEGEGKGESEGGESAGTITWAGLFDVGGKVGCIVETVGD